jgi:hypothetical protein
MHPHVLPLPMQPVHTYQLNHAFRIKHHHGLNSSSVTTTTTASSLVAIIRLLAPIFIAIGGPLRPIETPPDMRVRIRRFDRLVPPMN